MPKVPIVPLKWEKPKPLEEVIDDPFAVTIGVYYILREYGSKQHLYYIGKVPKASIKNRMRQHLDTTAKGKQGRKYVSYAKITRENCPFDNVDVFIDDIESTLIY